MPFINCHCQHPLTKQANKRKMQLTRSEFYMTWDWGEKTRDEQFMFMLRLDAAWMTRQVQGWTRATHRL